MAVWTCLGIIYSRSNEMFECEAGPSTDLAPEFASDARVLNRLSGHLDSATRERVYQEKENRRVRARAAETRQRMRQYLREPDRPDLDDAA